ncbi:hypothetical protein C8R47DRAFT_1076340 [Mycena vitilis]|nr:hypothetical protein C8R47DRAFT_1076340 [Mycena vitilis]
MYCGFGIFGYDPEICASSWTIMDPDCVAQQDLSLIQAGGPDPATLWARLAALDEERAELEGRLDQLAQNRILVIDALKSICSIRALPQELMREIFVHYVANSPLHLPDSYRSCAGPPLLASVCRMWRHIALNIPALWSDITVCRSPSEMLIQCCLARASNHPLVLDLDLSRSRHSERSFAVAAQYSMQWKSLKLFVNPHSTGFINGVQGHTPLLNKLVLSVAYAGTTPSAITAFCDAPQLQELELDTICMVPESLPWSQITHLTCRGHSELQIRETLRLTPRLEKFTIYSPSSFPIMIAPETHLDYLRTLEICDERSYNLLGIFVLPALDTLVLHSRGHRMDAVLRLVARSGCELRSISIFNPSHSFAVTVLEALSTLRHVEIRTIGYHWWWTEQLRAFFNHLATDAQFLPNLQTLAMEWDIRAVPHAVVDMLESRRFQSNGGWTKLESFKLWCGSNVRDSKDAVEGNRDLQDRLRALAADGLQLELPGF